MPTINAPTPAAVINEKQTGLLTLLRIIVPVIRGITLLVINYDFFHDCNIIMVSNIAEQGCVHFISVAKSLIS